MTGVCSLQSVQLCVCPLSRPATVVSPCHTHSPCVSRACDIVLRSCHASQARSHGHQGHQCTPIQHPSQTGTVPPEPGPTGTWSSKALAPAAFLHRILLSLHTCSFLPSSAFLKSPPTPVVLGPQPQQSLNVPGSSLICPGQGGRCQVLPHHAYCFSGMPSSETA